MTRRPRWYKVAEAKANAMHAAHHFPIKQTENGQWWVLCAGSELWSFKTV